MQLDDRELIARTLQAEAGNQGLGGMLAVGSVIKNRMGSGQSFRDVILAPAQFSAWNKFTGAAGGEQGQDMSKIKPSKDAYAAADALISGNIADITGGATHYYNPDISNPAWGASAGGDWTKIGSHVFGKAGGFRTGAKDMIGAQAPQQMAQQEQPRGLLGGMIDRDFADQLYMAALAGSPNAQRFQPLIQQVALDRERRVERKDAQAKANVTASYLDSIGQENLGKLVREGGITGAEAIKVATSEGKNFKDIERYKLAQSQGYKGTYLDFEADLAKIEQTGEVPAGLKAMNEKFGEEFLDIDLVGLGEARNRAAKIKTVLDKLEAGEQLTGPLLGAIGEFGRSVFAPTSQQAKDLVESVVQTSLREILGGQFAQQEGKELIKRSYNINLPPEQNAARLRALFAQLDAAAEAKAGMAKYFKENNFSLAGYEGSKFTPSRADLEAAMDAAVVTDSPDTKAAPAVQPVVINGYKIEKIQ